MSHPNQPNRTRRRAVAAVEAAVVLPLLVVFLAAIVDLGRLAKVTNSLSNAARNGAQYGSVNTTAAANSTGIRAAAVTEMAYLPNVTTSNPSVTATTVTNSGTKFIKVTVTYDMTGTSFFNLFSVNSLTRTVEMPMMPQ
jgi:Flp pilus assembly protein TadG